MSWKNGKIHNLNFRKKKESLKEVNYENVLTRHFLLIFKQRAFSIGKLFIEFYHGFFFLSRKRVNNEIKVVCTKNVHLRQH